MHSKTMALHASKWLVNHGDIRLVACLCSWTNILDWVAPSLFSDTGLILRWCLNNDATFRIHLFKIHALSIAQESRQTPPSAAPDIAVAMSSAWLNIRQQWLLRNDIYGCCELVKVMFNCGVLLVKIMFKCGILRFISQDLTNRIVEWYNSAACYMLDDEWTETVFEWTQVYHTYNSMVQLARAVLPDSAMGLQL